MLDRMGMITITRDEYDKLCDAYDFLQVLEAGGVDNWVGYEYAVETLECMRAVSKKKTEKVNPGGTNEK